MERAVSTERSGRLVQFAQQAIRLRRLARIEALTLAVLIGAAAATLIEMGLIPHGAATEAVGVGVLPVMAILAYLALAMPPRVMGPVDPIVDLVPNEIGLHVLTARGRRFTLRWRDPSFEVRFEDFRETTSRTSNIIRILVGHAEQWTGGLNSDDLDSLVHEFRARGMDVANYRRPRGLGHGGQFVTEIRVRAHARPRADPDRRATEPRRPNER
ncbi:MAG TPA: hypothetical protein VEH57_04420 [Thermoplasmata archaeon]|nr:hypothetical protein [Thermoplasmata archaeon]